MRIEETPLPGVGVRHDFVTRAGARVGVISHRTGRRELLVYDGADPDTCSEVLRLEEDEGHALADLLGGTTVTEHLQGLKQEVEGLTIDWVPVGQRSRAVGHTLADAELRQETGAVIVAVIREGLSTPAPGGDFRLEAGDTTVIAGSAEGVVTLGRLLAGE